MREEETRGGWRRQIDSAQKRDLTQVYLHIWVPTLVSIRISLPAIPSLADRTLEAAPLSWSHLLYVNQLANRSVRIDVDITTNRHLGT